MDAQTFLDSFVTIADSPGGIQRLRGVVITLALHGRLTGPDPTDEPVDSLLQAIDDEREEAFRSNGWRSARSAGAIRDEERPWVVPAHWTWVRLERLALPQPGFSFKSTQFNHAGRGMPLIRIRDIGNGTTECHFQGEYREEFIVQTGDYLVGMDGNFNIRKWQGPAALLNQRVTRLIFFSDRVQQAFVTWALQDRINALHGSRAYTTVQHLSGKQIAAAVIPVPPNGEQERIVAKVDELMRMCDDLEDRQKRRHRTTTRFRASAFHALTEAETPDDLRHAWERVRNGWFSIVDGPDSVNELRQAILRLAVEGRLVAQSPGTDEPAVRLVDQLAERRRSAGVQLPPEDRRRLPSGWTWASFGQSAINRDADRVPLKRADRAERAGNYDYYGASGVIDQIDEYIFEGDYLLLGEDGANLVLRSTPIAFIASGRFWVNNHAHVLESLEIDALKYLAIFINSIDLRPYLTGIAQPKLNQSRMNRIPVPLPPLTEQRRIVERVGQLLDICDDLRNSLVSQQSRQVAFGAAACRSMVSMG
jgi:type I restriction enzyme S subunit